MANGKTKSVLGSQSILPKRLPSPRWERENENGISCQQFIYGEHDPESSSFSIWLKSPTTSAADISVVPPGNLDLELFEVSLRISEQPQYRISLTYVPHREILLDKIRLELVVKYSDPLWERPRYQYQPLRPEGRAPTGRAYSLFHSLQLQNSTPNTRLTAISIRCSFDGVIDQQSPPDPQRLVTLDELSILPCTYTYPSPYIFNIRVISMNNPPNSHKRLAWDWRDYPMSKSETVPWSATTGPFSHFRVSANGKFLGDAWATQFVLRDDDLEEAIVEGSKEQDVYITIEGFMFSGGSIRGEEYVRSDTMVADHEDWVHL
jgi:hypothetical protein